MTLKELRELIASLAYDIEFEYRGVHGSICPINHNDIALSYGDNANTNTCLRYIFLDFLSYIFNITNAIM